MNQYWTRSSEGDFYNEEAMRREARKRDGIIHFHSPEDKCSKHEHEKYEDGELQVRAER